MKILTSKPLENINLVKGNNSLGSAVFSQLTQMTGQGKMDL